MSKIKNVLTCSLIAYFEQSYISLKVGQTLLLAIEKISLSKTLKYIEFSLETNLLFQIYYGVTLLTPPLC